MKIKERVVSAIITFVLATMSTAPTIFAESTFDDVIFDLQSLGIMTGDENGDLQLDKPVTRAEFATLLVRMMSMEKSAEAYSDTSKFTDVPDNYWAKGAINFLTSINVISGTSETTFEPEANIDINAASKMLVCALGYDIMAQRLGGYPTGYITQANSLDILDGVDTTVNPITRREVAKMIYNSLDADVMILSYESGRAEYKVDEGNTYRNRFSLDNSGVITKLTGLVTATADTYLDNPVSGLEENKIEINGAIYEIPDTSYNQFIGQKVDFFVEDENSNVIISMKPSSETSVTNVVVKDIDEVTSGRVKYSNEEDLKNKTVRYDTNGYFLYNNRVVNGWNESNLENLNNGTLTFIDNDDDDIADVIIAKEYSSVIADKVTESTNTIYFKEDQMINGKKFIKVDEDEDQRVTLYDTSGKRLTVADIKEGSTLTCTISPDGQMVEVIVNDNVINGKVNGIAEDYILVDGTKYYLENENNTFDISNGSEYSIYLNFNNEVAYVDSQSSNENYAYISKVYLEENGESYTANLVLPNTIQEKKEEVENADGGEATIVSTLACQNSEVIKLPLADKVNVDGTSMSPSNAASALANQVVIYSTNSDGELSRVKKPEQIGTGVNKYYNSSERTFGKTSGGAFGVDMNTMTICIPKDNPNPSEEDYLTAVEMNNGQLYDVKGYEQNAQTHMAQLIVVTMTMKAGTAGLVTTSSDVGMVNKCEYEYDTETGDYMYTLSVLTEKGNVSTYRITEAFENSDGFVLPKKGDLISYSLDIEYNIDALKVLGSMGDELVYGRENARGDYETFCGLISNIDYSLVSENLNRWVHVLSCTAPSGDKEEKVDYEILKFNGPPVFIYQKRTSESTMGTIEDIDISSDEIFVSVSNNSVRAVVVIR